MPKKSANFGQRCCQRMRSPLVMLKAWFAHFGSVAIQTMALASNAASVA
jgi:hypothetical protein